MDERGVNASGEKVNQITSLSLNRNLGEKKPGKRLRERLKESIGQQIPKRRRAQLPRKWRR